MTTVRCRQALLGVALFVAFDSTPAADAFWGTSQDAFFEDSLAWLFSVTPSATDRAVFAAPYSGSTVSFMSTGITAGLLVSNSVVTLDLGGQYFENDGLMEVKDGGSLTWRGGLVLGSSDVLIGGGSLLSSLTVGTSASFSVPSVYVGHTGHGLLTVQGGYLETGLLQAGHASGYEGRIVVDGSQANAERTYLGGSEVCVPFCNVGVGPGKLEIVNGGRFTSGVLSLAKNGNAQVTVGAGGQLAATDITISQQGTASLTVDGGSLRAHSIAIEAATASTPASSGIVDVKGGGHVEVDSVQVGPNAYSSIGTISADRRLNASGAGTQVIVNGRFDVKGGGSRASISEGAYLRTDDALIAGSKGTIAEVTVSSGGYWENRGALETGKFSEAGSRLTIDGGRVDTTSLYFASSSVCSPFCNVAPRSELLVRNHGVLNTGTFFLGRLAETDVSVESGSQVHSSGLAAGGGFAPVDIAMTGRDTAWLNDGDASLGSPGALPAGTVLLQLDDGAQFRTGGALSTTSLATVRIRGGSTLEVGSFATFAGVLDFQAGHVITHGDLAIQPGAPLGADLQLESNRTLTVYGTTTIGASQTLTVGGGRFSTGSLVPLGTFSFASGVLALTGDAFTVGPGGLLGSGVTLTDARRLEVTHQLTVAPSGILNVAGDALTAGTLRNEGTVQLGGGVSRVTTGNLENVGRLLGSGAVQGNVDNGKEGQIRVTSGQELDVAGRMRNSGQVFVLGGTLQVGDTLDNAQGGFVSGRGVLATGGVTNVGTMAFSGTTDLIGNVRNEKDGSIVISGASTLTFYDDVVHNGAEIRASPGSNAVFFGSVEGAGKFTGGGAFFFEGDLRPGNSPAITSITGDATLGYKTLEIEIAGLVAGREYDAVHVSGSLTLLGGTLYLRFLDGFTAATGDSFDVLDFASLSGTFAQLNLPGLANGLMWDSSQLYSTGVLSVQAVPEPSTYALMVAGLLLAGSRALLRRRPDRRING